MICRIFGCDHEAVAGKHYCDPHRDAMNKIWPSIKARAMAEAEVMAAVSIMGEWDQIIPPKDDFPRGNDVGPIGRPWLHEIRRYTDVAVRPEDMGMLTVLIPEFVLSIYEWKRWIKRVGDRIVITQWGRNFLASYE